MQVKVSAIVSTYNSAKFLQSRLQNLLDQTLGDALEIIVVNSGSLQHEREIVRSFQARNENIHYIETDRENLYSSWNRALEIASGDYITNANTDDRLWISALEIMSETLTQNPNCGLVYADSYRTKNLDHILAFDELVTKRVVDILAFNEPVVADDWQLQSFPDYSHAKLLLDCLCGPQPMWRKSLHEKHGLFSSEFVVAGDYDFWLRIAEDVSFLHLPQPLGLVFNNPEGIENKNRRLLFDENKLIRLRYFGGLGREKNEGALT